MRRRDAKLQSDAQRLPQRHSPPASLRSRGEGGGVLPKRLKSGAGHHRLEICWPSNGHHMNAKDRPVFFALFHSLPRAIDDALDTLYEPNAVFGQFLGSASMTFFLFSFPCFLFFLLFLSFLLSPFFFIYCFSLSSLCFISLSFLCFFFQLTCVCRAHA